tara:strand:+ start:6835 stop:7872 length:1038 start_codon:yes stop_codon:yes gene_type:complete
MMMNDFAGTHFADGEMLDNISVSRSGALNKALIERLTKESVSDNWEEAKHEWRATGNTWYIPLRDKDAERLPEVHQHKHPHYCICGHEIAWHFEIENTENGELEILGSEHITNWMIIRHLIEHKGVNPEAITEELIQEWLKEAVKSMKAEWWWNEYGDEWEELFNEVKELDLRVNVREKGRKYSYQTRRYEPTYVIAKTKKGSLGKMASVVWRWNHPNNARRQIETRGYPNERLWRDVQLLYAKKERFTKMMDNKDEEKAARIEYLNPTKKIAEDIRATTYEQQSNELFTEALALYDLPYFSSEDGKNTWEKNFLVSIRQQIIDGKELSLKQLNKVIKIIGEKNE